jgi:hypothetical protein
MQQRLGIPARNEGLIPKLTADRHVVEDLSVEGEPPISIRVAHRLMRPLADIDDREARVDEANIIDDLQARPVRSAVRERISHSAQALWARALAAKQDTTGNSTHDL